MEYPKLSKVKNVAPRHVNLYLGCSSIMERLQATSKTEAHTVVTVVIDCTNNHGRHRPKGV